MADSANGLKGLDRERYRVDNMTGRQLQTRLGRITKPEKLRMFVIALEEAAGNATRSFDQKVYLNLAKEARKKFLDIVGYRMAPEADLGTYQGRYDKAIEDNPDLKEELDKEVAQFTKAQKRARARRAPSDPMRKVEWQFEQGLINFGERNKMIRELKAKKAGYVWDARVKRFVKESKRPKVTETQGGVIGGKYPLM